MDTYIPGMSYNDFLAHHGIKGMRWGIRRYQNKDGSLTTAGKRRLAKIQSKRAEIEEEEGRLGQSTSKKSQNPHGKKSVFEMSDDELKTKIERLGLERQYKSYMSELYPSKKKAPLVDGRKVVSEILTGSLTTVGKSVAMTLGGEAVNKVGRSLGLQYDLYQKPSKKK